MMAPRRLLDFLSIAALAVCALVACKGKDQGDAAASAARAVELDNRCVQLAKVCGDKGKHVEKILDECKLTAKTQVATGCTDKAIAVYDCYIRDVCGNGDKVWAMEDVRVLAERHSKCVAEQAASVQCDKK